MEDFEENEQMELDRTDENMMKDFTDSGYSVSTDNGDESIADDVGQGPEVQPQINYRWKSNREITRPRKSSSQLTGTAYRAYSLQQQQPKATGSAFNPFSIGHKGTLDIQTFDGQVTSATALPRVKSKHNAKRNSNGHVIFEDDWGPPANWTGPDPLDPSVVPQEKRKKSICDDTDN